MADFGMRTRERRFQASLAPEDELAWLRGRLRAGQRLEWAAYARLAELAPAEAAAWIAGLVEQGLVQRERLGLAACCGHTPARVAQGWVTTTTEHGFEVEFLRSWVRRQEPGAFELVRAAVVHLVGRATASGAWTADEQAVALEGLEDCWQDSSWSARTHDLVERGLRGLGPTSDPLRAVRDATRAAVMCLGGHRLREGELVRALEAALEAVAALGLPAGCWGEFAARVMVEPLPPPPPPRELRTSDGFARFTCLATREQAFERVRATKEFRGCLQETLLAVRVLKVHCGRFFGAMQALFGRPHDLHDDWKQSISWYLDVDVDPGKRGRHDLRPVRLLMRVSDWKGSLEPQLRMSRTSGPDDLEQLEDGHDVLPPDLRVEVLSWFLGFVEGCAAETRLPDFERTFAGGEEDGLRYGVRDGVPFDEARPGSLARSG